MGAINGKRLLLIDIAKKLHKASRHGPIEPICRIKLPLLSETLKRFATRVASGNSSRHTAAWRQ